MFHVLVLLFSISLLSLSLLLFSLYGGLKRPYQRVTDCSLSESRKPGLSNPTQHTHSLRLEILPSDSARWSALFRGESDDSRLTGGSGQGVDRVESCGGECGKKKKKRRGKKKRSDFQGSESEEVTKEGLVRKEEEEFVCFYPLTTSSSATQRKIKQQYDQLVKSHESNGLTLVQVAQFVNCLIEARNELQHKSNAIQRKFTITKALLLKANRSSFDRLRQQIYKIELEQKRLEEDAFVYNWLQQQLKLSPAYKKMLEIGARLELKDKCGELVEDTDPELCDVSFEDFLAQEKKDSFWQKNGKLRTCTG